MSVATASTTLTDSLAASRDYCAALTKREARNFYYGLKLLPRPKRQAMFALYAYMRLVDDIADAQDDSADNSRRLEALDAWGDATNAALAGRDPGDGRLLWPAFAEMAGTFGVPHRLFADVIAGQRQDLDSPIFQTFDELREYCYRVAGVVGIASIYIWGFTGGEQTESLAIDRGVAFQLTNILRDLREDGDRGRIYLPKSELRSGGISDEDLLAGRSSPSFENLMRQQISRAQSYYDKSSALESLITEDCRPTLTAMTQIYHGILVKMSRDPVRVLRERISLSTMAKIRIAWRATRARRVG